MKRVGVLVVTMLIMLTACVPAVPAPAFRCDKLTEIQVCGTLAIATNADYALQSKLIREIDANGSLQTWSTKHTGLDLAQEAAQFDPSILDQTP